MRMSEHIIQILLLGKIRITLLWLTSELCGLLRRNIGQRAPRGFVTGPTALTAVTGARGRQARARPALAAGRRGPARPAAAADATGTNLGVWAAGRPATRPRVHAKTRWASKACPTASSKPRPAGITSAPPTSLRAPTVHVHALHRVPFPVPRRTRPPPLAASIAEPRAGGHWEGHRSTARGVRAQLGAPPAAAWRVCAAPSGPLPLRLSAPGPPLSSGRKHAGVHRRHCGRRWWRLVVTFHIWRFYICSRIKSPFSPAAPGTRVSHPPAAAAQPPHPSADRWGAGQAGARAFRQERYPAKGWPEETRTARQQIPNVRVNGPEL